MGKTLLLTGAPGCGKTTLLRRVVAALEIPAGGFYTREIRERGVRKGFDIITLDGSRGVLAHVDIRGGRRVGKYGVDLSALEAIGVNAIQRAVLENRLVVIDEIGPMEILSESFRRAVLQALQSQMPVLGTIVARSTPFTEQIKSRREVMLIEVRPENRDWLPTQIIGILREEWTDLKTADNITEKSNDREFGGAPYC